MVHVGTLGLVFEPIADALEAVVEQRRRARSRWSTSTSARRPSTTPSATARRIDRLLPAHPRGEGERRRPRLARPRPRRGRGGARAARRRAGGGAAHARRRGRDGGDRRGRDRRAGRARSRWSTRSARATRSAAASSPGGGAPGWAPATSATTTRCSRRRASPAVVAGRTVERAGASPPRLAESRRLTGPTRRGVWMVGYGVTIGFTLCGSSRLGPQRGRRPRRARSDR